MVDRWVVIRSYSYLLEAELARASLETAGYEARLENAQTLSVQTFLSEPGTGIQLVVKEPQAFDAVALLDQDFSAQLEPDGD